MKTFENLWADIETYLKSKASKLGVPADNIVKAADRIAPPAPPFIHILCLPAETDEDNAGNSNYGIAEITIFCGAEPQQDTPQAIIEAVKLAGRVRMALVDTEYAENALPPEFVEQSSNYTCVAFDFTHLYYPYEDLIT